MNEQDLIDRGHLKECLRKLKKAEEYQLSEINSSEAVMKQLVLEAIQEAISELKEVI